MFTIDNLSFEVADKKILQNISTTIRENRITAIAGQNGSGKSTLLSFLTKDREEPGSVRFGDRLIDKIPRKEYARHVAVLPQNNDYTYNLFVHEIVLMGRYPYKRNFGDYSEEDHAIVAQSMETVGVTHLAKRRIKDLSGGELQRVLIAKVFAQETETVLFDEPTNHLDVKHKIGLMSLLRKCNKTVVIVLHDLALIRMFCDDVILLDEGKLIHHGPVKELMVPEILNPIFGVTFVDFKNGDKDFLAYY